MEPVSLATAVISLVAAFLNLRRAGKKVSPNEEAADKLYKLLCDAAEPDRDTKVAITRLAAEPDDKVRRTVARDALMNLLEKKPTLAHQLEEHLPRTSSPTAEVPSVSEAGVVSINSNVDLRGKYVAGRDQFFGEAPDRG